MKSLNYAHRGFSGAYPENTMIAFEKALEAGADGIELDVQLTSDEELVIFHDDTLDRLTNGSGYLIDHTLAELKQLSFKTEKKDVQIQTIPTLEEYLKWVSKTDLVTNIELKATSKEDRGLEKKVIETLATFDGMDQMLFSSFHEESLARIKQFSPNARTGLLVLGCREQDIQKAYEMEIDYLHPRGSDLNEVIIEHIHKMGLKINAWTINLESSIQEALAFGIDGIITDYPDRVDRMKNSEYVK
ncbi:glycerophosphodiester phosphodiesterase [Marinilactibacillus kalidii]|uniref:glycerophosphodiester phosphodiesterase n=1 Tax=Marinilactibacillus kalidii TaxID=2820274 RepID=UPI001ABEB285|nr:glycerophosphodiester phosphodiesterase family protein [Marinilactibacillus kalidii]